MVDKQKEILSFVIKHAIRLGAALGSWLDTDMKFCNIAAHDALDAMLPRFVNEIERQFKDLEQEEAGYCRLCGRKKKQEDET